MIRFPFSYPSMLLSLSSVVLISTTWIGPSLGQTQPTPLATPAYTQIFPQTSELALTPEQQFQLTEIAQDTREQLMNILNPTQQQQLQTALNNGQTLRDAAPSLGLSGSQRSQLQATVQAMMPELQAVLTPEQMEQLQSQQGRRGFFRRGG